MQLDAAVAKKLHAVEYTRPVAEVGNSPILNVLRGTAEPIPVSQISQMSNIQPEFPRFVDSQPGYVGSGEEYTDEPVEEDSYQSALPVKECSKPKTNNDTINLKAKTEPKLVEVPEDTELLNESSQGLNSMLEALIAFVRYQEYLARINRDHGAIIDLGVISPEIRDKLKMELSGLVSEVFESHSYSPNGVIVKTLLRLK